MDTADKIKVFESFETLTHEIIRDKGTCDMLAQRYAVRFIMLNNFNEIRKLAKFMADIGVDFLDLENLISEGEDDEWITKGTLKDAIKACKSSTFVTPFSEIVRFYNEEDFRGFFNEIMLLEDIHNTQKRIYIPLIGLQNRFTDFLNHFARIQESAPIWRYDAEVQSVEVFFAKYKNFVLPNGTVQCQLDSLRDWLRFWKVQAPQERIVCTSMPISAKYKYSKPDNIFNFTKIDNAYEFMTKFLDLSFPFAYSEDEKSFWEELLKHIDKANLSSFYFETFVHKYFNKVQFDASDVIMEWGDKDKTPFCRWLLKNFVHHTNFAERYPYLSLCMESTISLYDDYELTRMIATRILYESIPVNLFELYAKERKTIIVDNHFIFENSLSQTDQLWLFDRIREVFQKQHNLDKAIDICTGIFDFEKKLLIGWSVFHPDNNKLNRTIKSIYPEFENYRLTNKPSHFLTSCNWCIDYFKAYKQAKLEDKYLEAIANTIGIINADATSFYKWYYEFESTHEVLAEVTKKPAYKPNKIYWIDGLGVEFMAYILYCINQENSDIKVIRTQITRSELPTSTHHNRFEGENVVKFGALDELGHDSHGYKQYDTLREELKVIKDIIHEIITSSKKEKCTIAIVSDHGLSCLSRKVPSKKYDGKFEHEGRYIKTTNDVLSDTDYLVYRNPEDAITYKIALTHSSLSKVPTHQVHGGCTPEEILVPFILLSNKDATEQIINYQIHLISKEVMLSNPTIEVSIIPEPLGASLSCNGITYKMNRIGTTWNARLKDITEGSHIIEIKPDSALGTNLNIDIVGLSGNTDINDMFDL